MKNTLKPILFTTIITLSAFFAIVYSSCKQDKCKAIACAYGGVCNDGVCNCLPGYEGPNCETVTRTKFLGRYQVYEQGTITPSRQYPLAIEADADVNYVLIKNMYNYFSGPSVRGIVKGDSITIPNQQILGKVVFGKGYIYSTNGYGTGTKITLRYEVVDSANNLIVDDFGFYADVYHSSPSLWVK